MPVKVPVKAIFREDGTVDALGEFVAGEFLAVDDGGTGTTSFNNDEILIGNGTNAITTTTRNSLRTGSSKITVNGTTNVSGVLVGTDVTIDIVESQIVLENCKGSIPFTKVIDTPEGFWDRAEIGGGAEDQYGNQVKDGGEIT